MWFIVALILGVIIGAAVLWSRSQDIKITWYEWLIGIAGVFLLLFTIQNYAGTLNELDSAAANKFLLVTGLPSIVLLLIAGMLVWRHHRATS